MLTREDSESKQMTQEQLEAGKVYRKALRQGKISQPDRCEQCGTVGVLDGHHENYSNPLSVEWLCRKCHNSRSVKASPLNEWLASKHMSHGDCALVVGCSRAQIAAAAIGDNPLGKKLRALSLDEAISAGGCPWPGIQDLTQRGGDSSLSEFDETQSAETQEVSEETPATDEAAEEATEDETKIE